MKLVRSDLNLISSWRTAVSWTRLWATENSHHPTEQSTHFSTAKNIPQQAAIAATLFIFGEDVDNRLPKLSPSWNSSVRPLRGLSGQVCEAKKEVAKPTPNCLVGGISVVNSVLDSLHSKLTLAESFAIEHDVDITNRKQNGHVIWPNPEVDITIREFVTSLAGYKLCYFLF